MKKVFTLLSCLFSAISLYAQSDNSINERADRIMEQSTLIFEGTLLKTSVYFNKDTTASYPFSTIAVTKVIKGDLHKGTVQIAYKGMTIAAHYKDLESGKLVFQTPSPSHSTKSFDGPVLPLNTTILFFCGSLPSDYPVKPNYISTDNKIVPEVKGLAYYSYGDYNTIISSVGGTFPNKQALYQYLVERYSLNIGSEEGRGAIQSHDRDWVEANQKAGLATEKWAQDMRKRFDAKHIAGKLLNPQANERLEFNFSTPSVTNPGSPNQTLDYDIYVSSGTGNSSYLAAAFMQFSYSTIAFGSNVVSAGAVTVTRGPAFANSTYNQPSVYPPDASDPQNSFRVSLRTPQNATSFNRTQITSTPIQLFHVSIRITNCVAASDVGFINNSDRGNYCLFTNTASAPDITANIFYYNPSANSNQVTYIDYPGGIPLCVTPTITNFSSQPIHGGIGEIVTIYGSNFGTTRGSVQMKDANVTRNSSAYLTLDAMDIIFWSDTRIEVRIPSYVRVGAATVDPLNPISGIVGSGPIQVASSSNSLGNSGNQELNIEYSITQLVVKDNSSIPIRKIRKVLSRYDCIDGYTFRLQNSIISNAQAVKVIEAALATMSVKVGIYLGLERDTQGNLVAHNGNGSQTDGINTITFAPATSDYLMLTSPSRSPECPNLGKISAKEADVYINIAPPNPWNYRMPGDRNGGNIQGYDFYSAFLHEIGHIIGLAHVITPYTNLAQQNELMYYAQFLNPALATRRDLTNKSLAAALANMAESRVTSWCALSSLETVNSTASSTCQSRVPLTPGLLTELQDPLGNRVVLRWNKIYNATGYSIESTLDPSIGFSPFQQITLNNTTTFTTAELDPNTTYYFRIKATNTGGRGFSSSSYSNISSIKTPVRGNKNVPTPLIQPPFNVAALSVIQNALPLNTVTWDFNGTPTGFIIKRSTYIDFREFEEFTSASTAQSYQDSYKLIEGESYYYKVQAMFAGSNGTEKTAYSAPAMTKSPNCTAIDFAGTLYGVFDASRPHMGFYSAPGINPSNANPTYTWNILPANVVNEGWNLIVYSPTSAVTEYNGPFPYTGPQTALQVAMTDNCGKVTIRVVEIPEPAQNPAQNRGGHPDAVVTLYPNPAKGQLTVELPSGWEGSQMRLINVMTGQQIQYWQTQGVSFSTVLPKLPVGVYIIEFSNLGKVQRQRLLIEP